MGRGVGIPAVGEKVKSTQQCLLYTKGRDERETQTGFALQPASASSKGRRR